MEISLEGGALEGAGALPNATADGYQVPKREGLGDFGAFNEEPELQSASSRSLIYIAPGSFADGDHCDNQHFVAHSINQPIAGALKFDFVCIAQAFETSRGNMWIQQPFRELFLELLLHNCTKLHPFLPSFFRKLQLISHLSRP